jgi:hypothetical protein
VRGKCLRKYAIELIGPSAVVLDDAIDNLGHVIASLLSAKNNVAPGR